MVISIYGVFRNCGGKTRKQDKFSISIGSEVMLNGKKSPVKLKTLSVG